MGGSSSTEVPTTNSNGGVDTSSSLSAAAGGAGGADGSCFDVPPELYSKIPGVITSDRFARELEGRISELQSGRDVELQPWIGSLSSLITQTMPEKFKDAFEARDPEKAAPSPEKKSYTFWEKVGAMPVNVNRLKQRQYYYPYTDFRNYTYDEASPEELELRARWMARVFDLTWQYPAMVFTVSFACCLPLPPIYRAPAMVACSVSSVFAEGVRVYTDAMDERQALDDFIVAKEFWYIKNVESLELGLLPKKEGSDAHRDKAQKLLQAKEMKEAKDMAMYATKSKSKGGFASTDEGAREVSDAALDSAISLVGGVLK